MEDFFQPHSQAIIQINWDPNEKKMFTLDVQGHLMISKDKKTELVKLAKKTDFTGCFDLSKKMGLLAYISCEQKIMVYDYKNKKISKVINKSEEFRAVKFKPEKKCVLSVSKNGKLKIFSLQEGIEDQVFFVKYICLENMYENMVL